ncbi:MAG: hypothetical protein K0S22_1760 [Oscillospiraceae bacterium]|jgi:hypothetical protein|nr:hypothetical protein [Oscillospiraceae bacterium]
MLEYLALVIAIVPTIPVVLEKLLDFSKNRNETTFKAKSAIMEKLYDKKFEAYQRLLIALEAYKDSNNRDLEKLTDVAYNAVLFMNDDLIELTDKILVEAGIESIYRAPDMTKEFLIQEHKKRIANLTLLGSHKRKLIQNLAKDLKSTTTF